MHVENVKQIIPYLRSTRYITQKNYSDNFNTVPRPFYNFFIMLEGEAHFYLSDKKVLIANAGDVIWIPKRSTFFVEWLGEPASWHVLHFDFSFSFNPFFNHLSQVQKLDFDDANALLPDFEALVNEKNPHLILSIFYKIFAQLSPLISLKEVSEQQYAIQPAINYLEVHYKEKIRVEKLASLCLLSVSRFQGLFKEIMGVSPIVYKNQILIQHVQQALLINKKQTLECIATEFGFESSIYMCRLYKQITGMTPSESRNADTFI